MFGADVSHCPLGSCPLASGMAAVMVLLSCCGLSERNEGGLIIALQGNLSNRGLPY